MLIRSGVVTTRLRLMIGIVMTCLLLGSAAGAVLARPPAQADPQALLLAARTDLETLANNRLGDGIRPAGWTNTIDPAAASYVIDLRLDLETLAGNLLGPDRRPEGWFGAVSGTSWAIARDIRHDLELLAQNQLGINRPELWIGAPQIYQCDRSLQAMVDWLQRTNSIFELAEPAAGDDYCTVVSQQANLFVDILLPEQQDAGDLRADLNALSREVFRDDVYPAGWTDDKDAVSIRQDLELLRVAGSQRGKPSMTPSGLARSRLALTGWWTVPTGMIWRFWQTRSWVLVYDLKGGVRSLH
jgi:hypothetical protein